MTSLDALYLICFSFIGLLWGLTKKKTTVLDQLKQRIFIGNMFKMFQTMDLLVRDPKVGIEILDDKIQSFT